MKINKLSLKIVVVVVMAVVVSIINVDNAFAGYYKDTVTAGNGKQWTNYEVWTSTNNKTHQIPSSKVYHSHTQANTKVTVTKGYSFTEKKTGDYGVGMTAKVISVEGSWGFSNSKTYKYSTSVAFTLDRKTPQGYYMAGIVFPGVKVQEKITLCYTDDGSGLFSKDEENTQKVTRGVKQVVKSNKTIQYVPTASAAKKLIKL